MNFLFDLNRFHFLYAMSVWVIHFSSKGFHSICFAVVQYANIKWIQFIILLSVCGCEKKFVTRCRICILYKLSSFVYVLLFILDFFYVLCFAYFILLHLGAFCFDYFVFKTISLVVCSFFSSFFFRLRVLIQLTLCQLHNRNQA